MEAHSEAHNHPVSGLYLRGVLAGLRKITGEQYPLILERAGLSEFRTKYPAANLDTVATGTQLIDMLNIVRELVGPVVFQLFYANLGRSFGQVMATLPQLQNANALLKDSPERVPRLVEYIGELHYQAVGGAVETIQTTTPGELHLIYHNCIYCAGQTNATSPLCVNILTLYRQLLLDVANQRCTVNETRCGAVVGSPDCHFLLKYKLG